MAVQPKPRARSYPLMPCVLPLTPETPTRRRTIELKLRWFTCSSVIRNVADHVRHETVAGYKRRWATMVSSSAIRCDAHR